MKMSTNTVLQATQYYFSYFSYFTFTVFSKGYLGYPENSTI